MCSRGVVIFRLISYIIFSCIYQATSTNSCSTTLGSPTYYLPTLLSEWATNQFYLVLPAVLQPAHTATHTYLFPTGSLSTTTQVVVPVTPLPCTQRKQQCSGSY